MTDIEKKFLTEDDLRKKIIGTQYHHFAGTTLTVAVLQLENGFTVTGEAACVDPKKFNEAKGREYAFENAFNKLWQLEGYLLQEKLYQAAKNKRRTSATHTIEVLKKDHIKPVDKPVEASNGLVSMTSASNIGSALGESDSFNSERLRIDKVRALSFMVTSQVVSHQVRIAADNKIIQLIGEL